MAVGVDLIKQEVGDEGSSEGMSSYRRLFAAKMLIHIQDYAKGLRQERALKKRNGGNSVSAHQYYLAKKWLNSDDMEPASFVWTCMLLDLDPGMVRLQIERKWREL